MTDFTGFGFCLLSYFVLSASDLYILICAEKEKTGLNSYGLQNVSGFPISTLILTNFMDRIGTRNTWRLPPKIAWLCSLTYSDWSWYNIFVLRSSWLSPVVTIRSAGTCMMHPFGI